MALGPCSGKAVGPWTGVGPLIIHDFATTYGVDRHPDRRVHHEGCRLVVRWLENCAKRLPPRHRRAKAGDPLSMLYADGQWKILDLEGR